MHCVHIGMHHGTVQTCQLATDFTLHFGQNVEMTTLGASGCDQCVGPVDVVTGWWIYSLPHNEVSILLLRLCFFGSLIPTFC